jgi:AcrR family transcriptional regulator
MGPESSAVRSTLMDAVEAVMREQGYAALSVRSVAARAGLKYQIVFYYFETMDDLLLTTYRRRTQRVLERTEHALQSEQPLHAFWRASTDPFDGALSLEYMAMSNHNAVIRAETIAFGERIRRIVAERLSNRLGRELPEVAVLTPFAISMAVAAIGGILGFEDALGISGGHSQTKALVEWCLQRLEPGARADQHDPAEQRHSRRRTGSKQPTARRSQPSSGRS